MKTWCDATTGTAIGKTAATYDTIGSTLTIKKNASQIIGFIVNAVVSKPTAGISAMPILRVTSSDLGISQEDWMVGGLHADAPASNAVEEPLAASFIPYTQMPGRAIGNAQIDFELSTSSAQTAGYDACVGIVYADGLPDVNFRMELMARQHGPVIGGNTALSAGGISAAAETAFTNTISVNSIASELRGLFSGIQGNAPAADDPVAGYTRFTASAIEDFEPQRWPLCVPTQGILGTPADSTPVERTFYWPTRFPLPKVNFTMSVAQKVSVAQNAAADGSAGATWA